MAPFSLLCLGALEKEISSLLSKQQLLQSPTTAVQRTPSGVFHLSVRESTLGLRSLAWHALPPCSAEL